MKTKLIAIWRILTSKSVYVFTVDKKGWMWRVYNKLNTDHAKFIIEDLSRQSDIALTSEQEEANIRAIQEMINQHKPVVFIIFPF